MSIGFIGLGNIGAPMACQLMKLGEELWVYDVAPAPVAELARRGARAGAGVRDIAEHCRIIGVCVRDEAEVSAVLNGDDGVFAHARPDAIIAVHSTVTQAAILQWAAHARERGIHLLDAPITGGASGAESATLTYMVGGASELLERCRPVFLTSGQRIIHAGPVGTGILLKLCNNLMSYAAFAAADEAERLAAAGGLDRGLLAEVGRSNGVMTPQMEAFLKNRSQLAAAGRLRQAFAPFAGLARKDLAAALASARELRQVLPATERVAEIIEQVFLNHNH